MEKNKSKFEQLENRLALILCFLQIITVGAAIYDQSIYLIGCTVVSLWIGFARLGFVRQGKQTEIIQKRRCKFSGVLLLPPSIALCALSVMPLLVPVQIEANLLQIGVVCTLVAIQAAIAVLSLIANRSVKTVIGGTVRYFDIALLCGLLVILVSRLLLLGDESEWAQMVCLTGCVMGGILFLVGCNMLLCTLCGYHSTKESLKWIHSIFRDNRRKLHFVSVGKDAFMVLVKLIMSIVSFSFFMFTNALFSCGIGIARYTALSMRGKNWNEQLRLYRRVSLVLMFSGICYAAYSVRLFFGGSAGQYNMIMALAIACYTFVDFGIQISELIKLRKRQNLEAEALRLVSFSGILVSFVLTQTAIMSFSEPGEHNFSDGLSGLVFGGLVVVVGIVLLIRYSWFRRKNKVPILKNSDNEKEEIVSDE